MAPRWPEEQENALIEGLRAGITRREIASRIGTSLFAVISKIKRMRDQVPNPRHCQHCAARLPQYSGRGGYRRVCDDCTKARERRHKREQKARHPERYRESKRSYYYRRKILDAAKEEAAKTGTPLETVLQQWGAL